MRRTKRKRRKREMGGRYQRTILKGSLWMCLSMVWTHHQVHKTQTPNFYTFTYESLYNPKEILLNFYEVNINIDLKRSSISHYTYLITC